MVVKPNNVRGVIAIKVSGCVPERFSFARRFCPPQIVKRGAAFRITKKQTATTSAAAAFHFHSRTNPVRLIYGRGNGLDHPNTILCVGVRGLELRYHVSPLVLQTLYRFCTILQAARISERMGNVFVLVTTTGVPANVLDAPK